MPFMGLLTLPLTTGQTLAARHRYCECSTSRSTRASREAQLQELALCHNQLVRYAAELTMRLDTLTRAHNAEVDRRHGSNRRKM